MYRWLIVLLVSAPLLLASAAAAPPQAHAGRTADTPLERQVRVWIDALSAQPPFAAWKHAEAEIQALGPGTHGWLVRLTAADGRPVGYLVVNATEDGAIFQLGEYGLGEAQLFAKSTLLRSLRENGLTPAATEAADARMVYVHPFAAYWIVKAGGQTCAVDAKTGEILPFDPTAAGEPQLSKPRQAVPFGGGSAGADPDAAPSEVRIGEPFDPYASLPWLTGAAPVKLPDAKKAQKRLRGDLRLRYVTEPFGDAVLYVLPVVGSQSWQDGRLDVALEMAGIRFVPLETLKAYGDFYA